MIITKPYEFEIFIPMKTKACERSRSTKSGFHYTPKETRSAKAIISHYVSEFLQSKGLPIAGIGCFQVEIIAYRSKPKTFFEGQKCISGGDWDNHGKTIGDALNGVVWQDDRMIVDGRCKREYGDEIGYFLRVKGYPMPEKPKKIRKSGKSKKI